VEALDVARGLAVLIVVFMHASGIIPTFDVYTHTIPHDPDMLADIVQGCSAE
jgi:peptidoglycan/LPS O-acetylase OafA/YrhL